MIKIFQNSTIKNDYVGNNSIIFSSSNNINKLKKEFINKDIKIITLDNYIKKIISDKYNKKLVDNKLGIIYMYLAFFNKKNTLKKYKDISDISFCNILFNTYDFYMENKVKDNDKTYDLNLIFNEYKRLLNENDLIDKYQMYNLLNDSLNEITYDNIYFFDIKELKNYEIDLINNLKLFKNVFIYANTINNKSLVKQLNKIDKTVYESSNNKDVNLLFEIGSNNLFNNVNLVSCNDLYEEVRYISCDIKESINNGLKFKDILIVSPDINRYENYFKMLFDFPYFKNNTYGILTKNTIKLLSKIIKGDFSCQNFINLLKLGVIKIDGKIVNDLDNYIYMWNLENNLFYEEFIYNPSGKKIFSENDYKKLEILNQNRIDVLNPIKYLISNIVGLKDAKEILKYLFTYMDEEEITNNLSINDYEGYMKFVELLELLNDNLDDISINDLLDLLNNCYNTFNINKKMIDEVNILNLNDYVKDDYKKVYFIGLTEKDLPSKFNYSTLINNNDLDYDVVFSLIEKHTSKENNLISNVLLNENIILTYHKLTDSYAKVEKSNILSKFNTNNISYKYEINKIRKKDFNLKIDKDLTHDLYGNNLILSPSSIETFAKCKYSYFLSYGLKLNIKEKMNFDNREVGTFVHFILENLIKDEVSIEDMCLFIDKYTDKYFSINLRNLSNTNLYVISELKESIKILYETIKLELSNNKFKPEFTELKIKDMDFNIKLDNAIMKITGIVDRVDAYYDDKNYYYRIIDYKTGTKKFRLDDVLYGLNMQMIIYLMAIKNSNIINKNIIPTGFLYYPALVHYKKESVNQDDKIVLDNLRCNLKMNGILNKDYLSLYDENSLGNYIDVMVRGNISEEKVLNSYDLSLIFNKVKSILKDEGNSILSGDIKVNPIIDSKNDSCKYCLFSSICKFDRDKDNHRKYKSISNKEAIKIIEGDLNGMD